MLVESQVEREFHVGKLCLLDSTSTVVCIRRKGILRVHVYACAGNRPGEVV